VWEKAIIKLVGLIYRLKNVVFKWVTKKQKKDSSCPRPAKRCVAGLGDKLDFSDTNDKKDKNP
jgi:hypothetical protein